MALVSFDFDDTLLLTRPCAVMGVVETGPNRPVLAQLRAHAAAGDTVVIVTSRCATHEDRPDRTSVETFVREFRLPVTAIHFTNGKPKHTLLEALGVVKHFDDDEDELALLSGIEGVLVPIHPDWGSAP